MIPTFTYGTEFWGGGLWKTLIRRFSRRAWRWRWCLKSKCILRQPFIFCWLNWRTSHRITRSQAHYRLQQQLTHVSPSWLLSKATSFSRHLVEHGFNTWHKLTTMRKASRGLSHRGTHDNRTTSKITNDDIKEAFLAKEWNSFHLLGKKLDYLNLKDFIKYEWGLYLKQPLTPPQLKIIANYRTLTHRLAIETRQWSSIPTSKDTRLCHLCSYNAVEKETHFVLKCPLSKPIEDMFPSLFKKCCVRKP